MKTAFYSIVMIVAALALSPRAEALSLPWLESAAPIQLSFAKSQHEELLKPLLEASLGKHREDINESEVELSLNKQIRQEKEIISKTLRSEGFYAATVEHNQVKDDIVYTIRSGERYSIGKAMIASKLTELPTLAEMKLQLGEPFRAATVLGAVEKLKEHIEKHHCLWEAEVSYEASVIHHTQKAEILLTVAHSPEAKFAESDFTGMKTIDVDYLQKKLAFKSGECFKRSKIEKSRLNLLKTGLLSGVESTVSKQEENVAILFDITERKHRTVKAGGGYSSDEGVGVSAGWEHRNIFGKAQKLEVNSRVSQLYRTVDSTLTIPAFMHPKQSLFLNAEASQEDLKAFDSTSLSASATLKRKLGRFLTGSIGGKLALTSIEEKGVEETFGLASFPLTLEYDRRDEVLDPKRGWVVAGELRPFVDLLDSRTSFIKTTLGGSAYYSFPKAKWHPTIAVRGAIGSVNGQNTDDIPADERYYSGGGGSVRGYPFQKLGPLSGGDPSGGRSFAELSLENRLRFSKDWGGVVFLDGGNAYNNVTPDFQDGLRWAYGAGARYYTDFAPIRLDVAVPLDRRSGVDDAFQFYVSIGQAF